jgi:hypothetical protein
VRDERNDAVARRSTFALDPVNPHRYSVLRVIGHLTPITLTCAATLAHAQQDVVPASVRENAECMFKVLQTIPGVSAPELGYVESQGWRHPFLEYRAAEENSWVQPFHFEARKNANGSVSFFGILPGIGPPGHLDNHVTDTILEKWRTQCGVAIFAVYV